MWWRISFIPSPYFCCWSFRLPLLGNPSSLIFSLFPRGVTRGLGWIRLKLSRLTKRNKTELATGSLLEEELCVLRMLYSPHMYCLHDPNLYPMKNSPLHQCTCNVGIRNPRSQPQLYPWLPVWQREPHSPSLSFDALTSIKQGSSKHQFILPLCSQICQMKFPLC